MPNAKEFTQANRPPPKILALGDAGSGKTTQFLSLPGKKFAYLFDPNAILSLQGQDVDYEEFLPDKLSLKLTSLKKDVGDAKKNNKGAELYRAWESDFEDKINAGFFKDYQWLMLDSFTTLSDMVMDGILAINGRGGMWPQQDDYAPQMLALTNIVRTCTSMGIGLYVTGHVETKQDDTTKKILTEPMMTGRLKRKLPILFSEIFFFEPMEDSKREVRYMMKTKPDRMFRNIRTSMKGLDPAIDVTLDFNQSLTSQGLGAIMRDFGLI